MSIITNRITDFIKTQNPEVKKSDFTIFSKNFFHEANPVDFDSYSDQDLYNAALSSFSFLSEKDFSGSKIRIFNPSNKKHGFERGRGYYDSPKQ